MNNSPLMISSTEKQIGIAADHGGFELREQLLSKLRETEYKIVDYGNYELNPQDDFPDFIIPLVQDLGAGKLTHGIGICTSGIGACVLANKMPGVRACLIHDRFSARQGVEDDNMNMICFSGRIIDIVAIWELTTVFLEAKFSGEARFKRRLEKISKFEKQVKL